MIVFSGKSFAEVYKNSLVELYNTKNTTSARGLKTKELTNVSLVIEDPINALYENEVRGSKLKYISAELIWYFSGRDDVEFISKYAKFWKTIQNEDGTANSSYGKLLFSKKNRFGKTQYQWALEALAKDKDSRQAVLHFNLPEHQYDGNKDFVCTMYGIFQIRDNKLNLTISMRSNDAIWGTPTDVAFFVALQSQMLNHLKGKYPELKMGTYTHTINSFHIYESHFDLVKNMIDKDFTPMSLPEVKRNLVKENGQPSTSILMLSDNLESGPTSESIVDDTMCNWIQKNILE